MASTSSTPTITQYEAVVGVFVVIHQVEANSSGCTTSTYSSVCTAETKLSTGRRNETWCSVTFTGRPYPVFAALRLNAARRGSAALQFNWSFDQQSQPPFGPVTGARSKK